MSTVVAPSVVAPSLQRDRPAVLTPLLPVAVAVTAGIVLDRYVQPPLALAAVGLVGAIVAWLRGWRQGQAASVVWLWLLTAVLGAVWHRVCHRPLSNDIGGFATEQDRLMRLRGIIWADPESPPPDPLPLRSVPGLVHSSVLIRVRELDTGGTWTPVQGFVKLTLGAALADVMVGDEVEIVGTLAAISPPSNPGEPDWQVYWHDQDVRATIHAKTADAVTVRRRASAWGVDAGLGRVRAWGASVLHRHVDERRAGVAVALVLGDQSALAPQQFEGYLRTGVFHVLAVSGQHLVILCGGLEVVLRLLGVSRRKAALALVLFVWAYALLTGNHPPVLRSAVVMTAWCGARILRRQPQPLNSLALAWLAVVVGNPSDLFQTGCQLSFLAVLALMQIASPVYRWANQPVDDAARLIAEARPRWQQWLRGRGHDFLWSLIISAVIFLTAGPLLAARFHLVSPVAILLSPFMIFFTSIALLSGFLCLLLSPLGLGALPAWFVNLSLSGCEWSVHLGERLPLGYWYVADLQEWWLWTFYVLFLVWAVWPPLRERWHVGLAVGVLWLTIGLGVHAARPSASELRCTFLAVGHGGCAVLETPDGRVLLYDTGSLGGPEVTARQIAPYLWHRGLTRIDEVFISHADLDHFNGLTALLDRFHVSQVSLTPTFAGKPTPGVRYVTDQLAQRGVAVRILSTDQRLQAGPVAITVLHPPADGSPSGTENARSLVLLVRYLSRSILLTGDLEDPGLSQVIARPAPPIDVLLAPHHGSPASNTDAFARWTRPGLAVTSEGRERGRRPDPYTAYGSVLWRTWQEGAVTVIIDDSGLRAQTFRTSKQWELGP